MDLWLLVASVRGCLLLGYIVALVIFQFFASDFSCLLCWQHFLPRVMLPRRIVSFNMQMKPRAAFVANVLLTNHCVTALVNWSLYSARMNENGVDRTHGQAQNPRLELHVHLCARRYTESHQQGTRAVAT